MNPAPSKQLQNVHCCPLRLCARFDLYVDDIVPKGLFTPPGNASQWFVQSTGSLRYDLYKGNVTVDDIYKVLPFRDSLFVVRGVSGSNLTKLLSMLNGAEVEADSRSQWTPRRPRLGVEHGKLFGDGAYISTNNAPSESILYDAFFVQFDRPIITEYLVSCCLLTHPLLFLTAVGCMHTFLHPPLRLSSLLRVVGFCRLPAS